MTKNSNSPVRAESSWTLDRLEAFAQDRMQAIWGYGRRTAEETWLLGEVLSYIRDITKPEGKWLSWVDAQRFSRSHANNTIKFFERIPFEDLALCEGMTVSAIKEAFDIIKLQPSTKRSTDEPASTPDQVAEAATLLFPSVGDHVTPPTSNDPDRHVRVTDYDRSPRKTPEPVVGPDLTPAERLGQVLNLIADVETSGITADCSDLLIEIEAKVAALRQTLAATA